MYCKGRVSISNALKEGLRGILDLVPIVILTVFFCSQKTPVLICRVAPEYNSLFSLLSSLGVVFLMGIFFV